MNDAIFYDMIKDEFNRIKDSPTALNTFIKLKSFELQDYQKLNDASPNSVSIQAIGILQTYIGNASQRLNEISTKAEAEVIAILTDVLNKTEAQPAPKETPLPPVKQWKQIDKGRFLSIIYPNETPPNLARKFYKKLDVKFNTLKRAIHKERDKYELLLRSEMDYSRAKDALIEFLKEK